MGETAYGHGAPLSRGCLGAMSFRVSLLAYPDQLCLVLLRWPRVLMTRGRFDSTVLYCAEIVVGFAPN